MEWGKALPSRDSPGGRHVSQLDQDICNQDKSRSSADWWIRYALLPRSKFCSRAFGTLPGHRRSSSRYIQWSLTKNQRDYQFGGRVPGINFDKLPLSSSRIFSIFYVYRECFLVQYLRAFLKRWRGVHDWVKSLRMTTLKSWQSA